MQVHWSRRTLWYGSCIWDYRLWWNLTTQPSKCFREKVILAQHGLRGTPPQLLVSLWAESPMFVESLRSIGSHPHFCLYFLGLLSLLLFFGSLQLKFLLVESLFSGFPVVVLQPHAFLQLPWSPMFADEFFHFGLVVFPILVGCITIWCWLKAPLCLSGFIPFLLNFCLFLLVSATFVLVLYHFIISNFGWFYRFIHSFVGVHHSCGELFGFRWWGLRAASKPRVVESLG